MVRVNLMKDWPFLLALLIANVRGAPQPGSPVALPVRYEDHRFIVEPQLKDGTKLKFFTDSGGAGAILYSRTVDRLKLPASGPIMFEGNKLKRADWPAFADKASIPPCVNLPDLFVRPAPSFDVKYDGSLGHTWFAGRVWTFDYPGQRLLWRAPGDLPAHDKLHEIPLGFRTDEKGERDNDFPRIQVTIDGEVLNFLFDTGATTFLTPAAVRALGDKRAADRAGSFINQRTFKKWRAKHPDWRVIEHAESTTGASLIEARSVLVAGWPAEPVWFTTRPDINLDRYDQMMDKPIVGAFGGSGMYPFRVTVDYVNAVAVFERP